MFAFFNIYLYIYSCSFANLGCWLACCWWYSEWFLFIDVRESSVFSCLVCLVVDAVCLCCYYSGCHYVVAIFTWWILFFFRCCRCSLLHIFLFYSYPFFVSYFVVLLLLLLLLLFHIKNRNVTHMRNAYVCVCFESFNSIHLECSHALHVQM